MAKKKKKKDDKDVKLKAKVKKLRAKIKALKSDLSAAAVPAKTKAKTVSVSPLAPAHFPKLPAIAGVEFASAAAGVKYAGRTDVMLARIAPGASIAGVFTTSSTRVACVLDCQSKLAMRVPKDAGAAIIVNSGNANAFTGKNGQKAVDMVTGAVAKALDLPISRVFSSSTGVIGEPLPFERIVLAVDGLAQRLSGAGIEDAARAIMTTDTYPKGASAVIEGEGGPITIAGIAKGSGMIEPNMATMLSFVFTDANVPHAALQAMLADCNNRSFNAITVDSDTSTSDTVLLAATGKAGNTEYTEANAPELAAFKDALETVLRDLAHQIVRDGEGATKFITVNVTGALNEGEAKITAKAIANSPLVKTAIAGEDANWGRIVMAVGKCGVSAEPEKLTVSIGGIALAKNGERVDDFDEAPVTAHIKGQYIDIDVDLGMGDGVATVWTCDLTHGYISINADYRS
jgi:glutamate N-acetyltransferase/amino-acid N-acetyltransferase